MAWMEFLKSPSPSWTSRVDAAYGITYFRSSTKLISTKPCLSGIYMELDDDDYGDSEFDDTDSDDNPDENASSFPLNLVAENFSLTSPERYSPEVGQCTQIVNAKHIDEITMIEGTSKEIGVPEQWDSLSIKSKILVPEQSKESCASASSSAEKLKRGKIRIIRNLMRRSLKVPSKGLLKPLLFKRKHQLPSI